MKNEEYLKGVRAGLKFATDHYLEPIRNITDFDRFYEEAVSILLFKYQCANLHEYK